MGEKTLTNEQICELVKEYAEEKLYQHALLLDGEWGSGKTHFVKKP